MSGTNGNFGSNNNGSILLGGGSPYTTNYYYDDVAIASLAYPGTAPTGTVQFKVDGVNFGSPVTLSGGTFTLSFGGSSTAAIASNATASAVQSALQSVPTIGANNALVSGPVGGPWQVRFAGALAGTAEPEMVANGAQLAGGTISVGTTSQGGDTGRVQTVTDPRSLIAKTDYDLLGRTLRMVENFVAFAPSSSADRTTQYTYDGNGHVLSLTAVLPGGVPETTQYNYGVTGSVVSSNDLLASIAFPANGKPNTESYTYNALGQALTKTDRNGSTHSYTYDILGRQTSDTVTTFGSGVDQGVKRIDTAYDTGDRPYLYTSYSDTGGTTVVNQVQQVYNGLGQLITEYQSHSGAVNISTTPKVQYGYSFVATSGGPNHSRLVSITYPNTVRALTFNYNSGVDDRISRVSSLLDTSATLESYAYLGLGTVVTRSHPQSGVNVNQTYIIAGGNSDGGDQYTGLDRFGRVIEQRWINATTSTVTDDFLYTYDRNDNRLTRNNGLNSSFNEQYGYDNLNQLTSGSRGSHTQSWGLDAVGNWSSFTSDSSTQTRNHNVQNEITSISGATTPTYDNNGNTTTDQTGNTYTYDAWNRLVKAVSGTNSVAYTVDAGNRRITTALNGGTVTDFYYSSAWRVLEEQVSGSMTAQYVWSPVYFDALVERDTSSQRLYAQQDANWNVTAIVDATGAVQERYAYDPYGKPTDGNGNAAVLTPTWGSRATSLFAWIYLHQGARYETTSGLYNFRNRDYSPTLGRWMQQDPVGYNAGDQNLYRYEGNNPTVSTDPSGLVWQWRWYDVLPPVALVIELYRLEDACSNSPPVPQRPAAKKDYHDVDVTYGGLRGCYDPDFKQRIAEAQDQAENLAYTYLEFAATVGTCASPGGKIPRMPRGSAPRPGNGPKIPPGSKGGEGAGRRIPPSIREKNFPKGQTPPNCGYCRQNPAGELDHVIPRSKNGDLTRENIVPACPHCNRSKGAMPAPVTPPANYVGEWPPPWWPKSMRDWWNIAYGGGL
jgi:RHS repeat-associated protein